MKASGAIWSFFGLDAVSSYDSVLADATMPGAQWFSGATVNFAEFLLQPGEPDDVAVIATDAVLNKAGCRRVAVAAQDGLARAIRPAHTPLDGDTVFVLATGAIAVEPSPDTPAAMLPDTALVTALGIAAADCLARAVLAGVLAAESLAGIPSYRDLLPAVLAQRGQ